MFNLNGEKKAEKIKYTKLLEEKRDELTKKLSGLDPGTEKFDNTRKAIEDIDKILNEKKGVLMNGLKIGGMLLLTALGLGLAHKDDIGDSIPGKFVSKFVDGMFNRISK